MAEDSNPFAIDDTHSTAESLAAFAKVLETMDATLGLALKPFLSSLASDHAPDPSAIWDALYAATASTEPDPTPSADQTEVAAP